MLEEETGEIKLLRQNPELSECAAEWFSQKWNVPLEAYRESIRSCVENEKAIPQWYVVTDRKQRVIAGAGVIENDFHDFPQCLCAVCGAALPRTGIERLYLVTDHTAFYEKCGWEFFTTVHDEQGVPERMYCAFPL